MNDPVYKKVELVGTSAASIEDAISHAVEKAAQSGEKIDWFEVVEIRGSVRDGKVGNYQLVLKVGSRLP
ncbi:Dodecin [uncultured Gammaproteobacteria bacterium]